MSFFSKKKKPSPSNSAPTQQQQFPTTESPSQYQQNQLSQPIFYPWSTYSPGQSPSPSSRHSHSLSTTATVAGELFLFGGYAKCATNDLYMFSTRDFSITPLKTSGQPPSPRYAHRAAFTTTTLLIWGGLTNHSHRNAVSSADDDSLYLLNLVSREWTRVVVNGPGPGGRSHHIVTLVGSMLFVFGGRTAGRFFNDIWAFDLNRLNSSPVWESYEPTPGNEKPFPRSNHVSVTTGDRIIIFGGRGGGGKHYFNDTWSFNISTREWTEVKCTGSIPSPRGGHAAVLIDNVMYVFGGRAPDGTDLGDLTALNLSTQRWVAFDDMSPSPSRRCAHAIATDGIRIFVLGGILSSDAKANESNLIYVLDTKRITFSDPDFNAVTSSEKATQLARESSSDPSIQGQTQQPTFSLSDSVVHPERGNSPLKEATPGNLDHPDSLKIAREKNRVSNNLPSLLPGVNDSRHFPEEGDDSECSADHHGNFVAPDASSEKESARLEHERIADLERQLSETIAAQTERDRRIAQLSEQLAQKSALLEQAEANAAEAKKRARWELRELQTEHLRKLEQTQSALQKATSRAGDAEERGQPAYERETELADVRAELEGKKSELEAVRLRFMDAEERCAKSKEEADTLRAQIAAGLINADVDRVMHRLMERVRSVEAEMESMRGNEKSIESMVCRNEG